ncbi:unnamed protein product [Adineta ricciae]|uniref:UNC93-like protein n=1 Tax=Adineta ricciae TaxID=249248 RepID=A0A813QJI2_ADIRI|nr:unnamed protein product [Adineta ricciae]CAF0776248.1 unnamed protein product [Adineta ricciae]
MVDPNIATEPVYLNNDAPKEAKEIEKEDDPPPPVKQWRIWKNLFVICLAWVLLFTAFQGISNLQSSLNVEGDVGMNSMAIIYAFLIFSSALLPHPMMSIFGMKWTIVICQFGYLAFIAANLHAVPALMYPASVFLGLAGAPMWTSEGSYVTQIGMLNAELKGREPATGVTQFFGIFFACFQTSQIWGNLISYLVLQPTTKPSVQNEEANNDAVQRSVPNNWTNITNLTENGYQCGAEFLEKEFHGAESTPVPRKLVFTLCYIYIGLAVASILLVAFLLDQRRTKTDSKGGVKASLKNSVRHMASTFKHLKHVNQILLIPFTLWSGFEQTYIVAQFTKGFITCAAGIKYVGLVMIVFGVCNAVSSFSFGHIAKRLDRVYCLALAAVISYALIITMLLWTPHENQLWVLFVLAGFWGIADGCWQTQTNAAYGVLFTEHESAFSNFRLWESLGYVIAYVYTPRIRIKYAHAILLCVLTISMICYVIIYIREKRKKKKVQDEKPQISPTDPVQSTIVTSF